MTSRATKIPAPTDADLKRDAEADYKWIATSTGQMFANIAAAYIRLYTNAETCFRVALYTIDELRDDLGLAEQREADNSESWALLGLDLKSQMARMLTEVSRRQKAEARLASAERLLEQGTQSRAVGEFDQWCDEVAEWQAAKELGGKSQK